MKNFKKITALLLALVLSFAVMLSFASCGDPECAEHVDSDPKDAKCDNCGKAVDCDEHVDADVNGNCDYCETKLGFVYTVTVVDKNGAPVAHAKVDLFLDGIAPINKTTSTGTDGKVSFTVKEQKNYYAKVTEAPAGYELPTAGVQIKNGEATVTLSPAAVNPTYSVYVKDTAGNAVVGAAVQICSLSGACQLPKATDADGKIESMLAEDGYKALIVSVPAGYVKPADYVNFEEGSYTLTITIELE